MKSRSYVRAQNGLGDLLQATEDKADNRAADGTGLLVDGNVEMARTGN
jgi:hypothetical protein